MSFDKVKFERLLEVRIRAKFSEVLLKYGRVYTKDCMREIEDNIEETLNETLEECGVPNPNSYCKLYVQDNFMLNQKYLVLRLGFLGEVMDRVIKTEKLRKDDGLKLV